jgi:hypothetical protein
MSVGALASFRRFAADTVNWWPTGTVARFSAHRATAGPS